MAHVDPSCEGPNVPNCNQGHGSVANSSCKTCGFVNTDIDFDERQLYGSDRGCPTNIERELHLDSTISIHGISRRSRYSPEANIVRPPRNSSWGPSLSHRSSNLRRRGKLECRPSTQRQSSWPRKVSTFGLSWLLIRNAPRTKAAKHSASSVTVFIRLVLLVHHRAATAIDASRKHSRGATSKAICLPLTMSKRCVFVFPAMFYLAVLSPQTMSNTEYGDLEEFPELKEVEQLHVDNKAWVSGCAPPMAWFAAAATSF